jgi:hypothetical protein
MPMEDFPTVSNPSPSQSSAREIVADQLRQWGLAELINDVDQLLREGLDAAAITLQLANTEAYKRRFAANEIRRQKGLPVLSPGEYIATEAAYKSVLRSYGLPPGFYDDNEDFHKWIGGDVSPDELNERAGQAQRVFLQADPLAKEVWSRFYGLSGGAAIAAILDPERAIPVVERMANAARFGAVAERQGLEADRGRLERYSDLGITETEIMSAFGRIAQTAPVDERLSTRFGKQLTQGSREAEELLGDAAAARQRSNLYQSEQALFSARSGADEDSLNRNRRGQY